MASWEGMRKEPPRWPRAVSDNESASERLPNLGDLYDFENEPTIPSMRVPAIEQKKEEPSRVSGFEIMTWCGILSSTMIAIGGVFDALEWIGIGGLVMIAGYMTAMVRK